MGLHVFSFYHGMGFSSGDSIFTLAMPFRDSFDEMGSLMHSVGMAGLDSTLRGGSPN